MSRRPRPRSPWISVLSPGAAALLLLLGWVGCAEREDEGVLWLDSGQGFALEPDLCLGADGRLWAVWLEWRAGRCELRCAWIEQGRLAGGAQVLVSTERPAEPSLAAFGAGCYVVFETGQEGQRELVGRALSLREDELVVGQAEPIAAPGYGRLAPDLERVGEGLELVWQELDGRDYDLYWSARDGGAWSAPRCLRDTPDDEWRPRASAGPDGALDVVYDRWTGESFDVEHLRLEAGRVVASASLASGPEHQADARLSRAPDGTLWIAWEVAASFGRSGALRDGPRSLALARLDSSGLALGEPELAGGGRLRPDHPQPVAGSRGLALLWRGVENAAPAEVQQRGTFHYWSTHLSSWGADPGASVLSGSRGDGLGSERVARGPDGEPWCVFAADDRGDRFEQLQPWFGTLERRPRVGLVRLPSPSGFPSLESVEVAGLAAPMTPPSAVEGAAAARPFFGDLHRHTHYSRCAGSLDGTPLDAYRYARGPGGLDFLAVTDHIQHLSPFSWWRTARDAARYSAPGSLVSFAATERMLPGEGHNNAIYPDTRRATSDLASHPLPVVETEVTPILIPHMTGIAANGIDWQEFDPQQQRLIEVYQGARGSYEGPGLPYEADDGGSPGTALGPALAGGRHFGLIASSDHRSTGTSFAGVWAPALERGAIFEALRTRRTFAATAPVRVDAGLGALEMGSEGAAPAGAAFVVRAEGASPIAYVEILENGERVALHGGSGGAELFVLTTRRGSLRPERPLALTVEGGELLSAALRRPASPRSSVRLLDRHSCALVHEASDVVDLVLAVRWDEAAQVRRRFAVQAWQDEWYLHPRKLTVGRSAWFDGQRRAEQLWRLGPPLGEQRVEIAYRDPEPAAGDVFRARVAFTDGNLAWTSPIRVTEWLDGD